MNKNLDPVSPETKYREVMPSDVPAESNRHGPSVDRAEGTGVAQQAERGEVDSEIPGSTPGPGPSAPTSADVDAETCAACGRDSLDPAPSERADCLGFHSGDFDHAETLDLDALEERMENSTFDMSFMEVVALVKRLRVAEEQRDAMYVALERRMAEDYPTQIQDLTDMLRVAEEERDAWRVNAEKVLSQRDRFRAENARLLTETEQAKMQDGQQRLVIARLSEGEGHVVDGVGICTRCGACSCCARSEEAMAAPCPGTFHRDGEG